jgi:uncharacterized protein (DUF2164 family)
MSYDLSITDLSTVTIAGSTLTGMGAGQVIQTGISASPYWMNMNDTIASSSIDSSTLTVKGDATFEDDISIKGKSLTKTLEGIEERLGILHTNSGLEDRWSKLKALGKKYRAMEADLLEKEKMWNILKK